MRCEFNWQMWMIGFGFDGRGYVLALGPLGFLFDSKH